MLMVFQVCFFVGIGFTVISFILGHLTELAGVDGLHLDFHSVGIEWMMPLSPALIVLFCTVFGGTGMILMNVKNPLPMAVIILISAATGILSSFLIYKFVITPLRKAQNTSAPDPEDMLGIPAVVTETIRPMGYGEISYVVNGNTFSAPAKATTEDEIKAGSNVTICWIESYIFYVSNINI